MIRAAQLEAYLDEALAPEEMARIEQALRDDPELVRRLATINARRDGGAHTLAEIWRRHRLSCFTRAELGSHLLGVLDDDRSRQVAFHVDVVSCRYCRANLADLQRQQDERAEAAETRRRKYFQSSVGRLRQKP